MRNPDRSVNVGRIAILGLGLLIAAQALASNADRAVLIASAAAEAGIVPTELTIAPQASEASMLGSEQNRADAEAYQPTR